MTRHGNGIVTATLAVICVVYLYFVFLPVSRHIDTLRLELAGKREFVSQDPGLKASIVAAETKLAETKSYVDEWKKRSPSPGELSPVFAAINLCTKKAGTRLDTFDPQPVVDYESLKKVPLRLGVHGSFSQVHELLRGLEELPPTIWIEGLKIEGNRDAGKPLSAEITLAVFAANPDISD